MPRMQLPIPSDLCVNPVEWAERLLPKEYKCFDTCILFIHPDDEDVAHKVIKLTKFVKEVRTLDTLEEFAWEIRFYRQGLEPYVVYSPGASNV